MTSLRHRFPGAAGDWARFDGPAGTQMVDVAIEASARWSASGSNANTGGSFRPARDCDELLDRTRATVGRLLGAPAHNVVFGANMTTLTFAVTRAIARTLQPGDRVVGTMLDHDANIAPWRLACADAGAEHVQVRFDPRNGRLDTDHFTSLLTPNVRWVAVTGASNLLGTMPDLASIVNMAHGVGARVFVDAVHLVPHAAVDVVALDCDALVTSPYKWYGPHAGVMYLRDDLMASLPIAKVRPAADSGPRRFETGTPNFESIAAVDAAARFLLEESMSALGAAERDVFAPLLDGLLAMKGVSVFGPHELVARTPTVAFNVDGRHPDDVAAALAERRIAVWSGHSYAVDVVAQLGQPNGVVRAGVSRYVEHDDVQRLLDAVATVAAR
ncbi:MAG: cysteine desulfurase-like protein [Ilumatobacteraceae bacterium]